MLVRNGASELSLKVNLTNAIPRGAVFVPLYFEGGVVNTLLPSENGSTALPRVTLAKPGTPPNGTAPAPSSGAGPGSGKARRKK